MGSAVRLGSLSVALLVALTGYGHGAAAPRTGPARYRACDPVALGSARLPTYAHNVSCAVAAIVVKRCSAHNCFGQLPLPSTRAGEPNLPQPPTFKPLGFECFQGTPPYTAGLPGPLHTSHDDPHPILCYRKPGVPEPKPGLGQQLVGYWLGA